MKVGYHSYSQDEREGIDAIISVSNANVSEKIVDWVMWMLKTHGKLFLLDDERLGLERFVDYKI